MSEVARAEWAKKVGLSAAILVANMAGIGPKHRSVAPAMSNKVASPHQTFIARPAKSSASGSLPVR